MTIQAATGDTVRVYFAWTELGVTADPSPVPSASQRLADGTISPTTLTKQGSTTTTRFYAEVTSATEQMIEVRAVTTDSDVDAAEWQEFVKFDTVAAVDNSAIADAVWDELIAGHLGAGSTGAKLNSLSAAADPWGMDLPGTYAGADAGNLLYEAYRKTQLIGAGTGDLITPTKAATGDIQLERSDDYTVNSGRILPSRSTDWWSVLSLTTAQSITFTATPLYGGTPIAVSLDMDDDVLSDTEIQIQFPRTVTDDFTADWIDFKVLAVLNALTHGGDHVTIWEGRVRGT